MSKYVCLNANDDQDNWFESMLSARFAEGEKRIHYQYIDKE